MAEEVSIFIRPNENYTYKTPFQTINIVQMSEDEQDDPDPKPPGTDPTEISISWIETTDILTDTINLPLTFDSQNTNKKCIGYTATREDNLIWGADDLNTQRNYSNYTIPSDYQVMTTISDFTIQSFMFYNISCPYLSENPIFSSGVDNIKNIQIEKYRCTDSGFPSPILLLTFDWQTTRTSTSYFIYDKTDNIFYWTTKYYNAGLNENHEQFFVNLPSHHSTTWFKTKNGHFYAREKNGGGKNKNVFGFIKITNASKYFPSVKDL